MRILAVAVLLLASCGSGVTRVTTDGVPHHHPFHDAVEPPEPTTTTQTPTTATTAEPPSAPRTTVTAASRGSARTSLDWEALRQCESGDDYADKANPKYRGAYQFSYDTWASVGGTGDPADASPDEQDMRAQVLYDRSGAGQWPTCGARL